MANDSHGYDETFALGREFIRQSYIGNIAWGRSPAWRRAGRSGVGPNQHAAFLQIPVLPRLCAERNANWVAGQKSDLAQ